MDKKTFTTAEKLTIAMVWFYLSSLPIIFSKRDIWICKLAGPGLLDHIHSSIGGGSDPFGQSFSGFFGRQVSDFSPVFSIKYSFFSRAELGGRGRMSAEPPRLRISTSGLY